MVETLTGAVTGTFLVILSNAVFAVSPRLSESFVLSFVGPSGEA